MSPDAAYDSWLTVGAVDISDMGSSVMHHGQWQPVSTSNYIGAGGIDFRTWTEANGLRVENGDVSWADPSSAPSCDDRQSNGCTIAQLTVPSQGHFTAIVNAEGADCGIQRTVWIVNVPHPNIGRVLAGAGKMDARRYSI